MVLKSNCCCNEVILTDWSHLRPQSFFNLACNLALAENAKNNGETGRKAPYIWTDPNSDSSGTKSNTAATGTNAEDTAPNKQVRIESLSYQQLRAVAKDMGISSKGKMQILIDRIKCQMATEAAATHVQTAIASVEEREQKIMDLAKKPDENENPQKSRKGVEEVTTPKTNVAEMDKSPTNGGEDDDDDEEKSNGKGTDHAETTRVQADTEESASSPL